MSWYVMILYVSGEGIVYQWFTWTWMIILSIMICIDFVSDFSHLTFIPDIL